MDRYYDRFARAIASVVNILDPGVIVLGGGLSNIEALYRELPPRVEHYAFTPEGQTRIVKNLHGDSSGVRGAAWLWPET
jgi:fructokinase